MLAEHKPQTTHTDRAIAPMQPLVEHPREALMTVTHLELPTDRPRSAQQTYHHARLPIALPTVLLQALKDFCNQQQIDLPVVLLAAWKVLLYRYAQQSDITIGCSMSALITLPSLELTSGSQPTATPIPLQTGLTSKVSVQQLLTQIDTNWKTASYQLPSIEQALETIATPPAYQFLFTYCQVSLPAIHSSQSTAFLPLALSSHHELALHLEESREESSDKWTAISVKALTGTLEFCTELFNPATIERLIGHWQMLLSGMVADSAQSIGQLPLLTPSEMQQLLVDWNQTTVDYPATLSIHQWFEQQVEHAPEAIAVVGVTQQVTYRELNQQANQLAHYLQTLGIQPEAKVAICVEPSIEMIVAFLAVLKAGGVYIPLDPTYPHERRVYKLRDAQAQVILTQQHLLTCLPNSEAQIVQLDTDWDTIAQYSSDNLPCQTTPDNLAYIIYTSGSTGNPKGVMITHRGMVNHSAAIVQQYEITPNDRVLQFSSMSFDIIIEEIFPSLVAGAAIVLRSPDSIASTHSFLELIRQQAITVLNLPTAFWHEWVSGLALLQKQLPSTLRLVVVGGEKPSRSVFQTWLSLVGTYPRWLNGYGPTETTVTATVFDPAQSSFNVAASDIPIGRPIANAQIYILDANLQPVPIGVPGELYIGGVGLGRGYLNRPDLTCEKFIQNPFSDVPGARLYRTGDTARYRADGNIEFVGRIDYQVKIRGFRIELGEIEVVLEKHPMVHQAIVLVHEQNGDKCLVAYVVTHADYTTEDLYAFLRQQLPDYMVPATILHLERFPLTPNGKIDRHALPTPQFEMELSKDSVAPRDDLEFRLAQVWQQVLGLRTISVTDNFFEIGGHSLLVARLLDRIEQVFQVNLPITTIFQSPTIEQFAEVLRQQNIPEVSIVAIQPAGTQPPLFLCEGISIYYPIVPHLATDQPVYGLLAPVRYDEQGNPRAIEALAADCVEEIRAVQPHGPYFLGGLSFGGVMAFEVAQQLIAMGEEVALLSLFDTILPAAYHPMGAAEKLQYHVQQVNKQGVRYIHQLIDRRTRTIKQRVTKFYSRWQKLHAQLLPQNVTRNFHQNLNQSTTETPGERAHTTDYFARFALNDELEQQYQPKPYFGKIVLFRALDREDAATARVDPDLGWESYAMGELDIHDVPGTHTGILQEPNVQRLGTVLQASLDRVLRG